MNYGKVWNECAKFCGSCAIVSLVSTAPPCHRAFVGPKYFPVGISWVQNIFSWDLVAQTFFFLGISWIQNFFLWDFVGQTFFLLGISWIQIFFSWVFRGPKILWFSINFSKKQRETYDWGILTESFKKTAFAINFG